MLGRGYFAPQTRASDSREISDLLNPQITSVRITLRKHPAKAKQSANHPHAAKHLRTKKAKLVKSWLFIFSG